MSERIHIYYTLNRLLWFAFAVAYAVGISAGVASVTIPSNPMLSVSLFAAYLAFLGALLPLGTHIRKLVVCECGHLVTRHQDKQGNPYIHCKRCKTCTEFKFKVHL